MIENILKVFDCSGILSTDEVSEITVKYERWCTEWIKNTYA